MELIFQEIADLVDLRSRLYELFAANCNQSVTNTWQAVNIINKPPQKRIELQELLLPDLPWAENHFAERVSGVAENPQPSELYWKYGDGSNNKFREGEIHSHTYSERFWPNSAKPGVKGIRYGYGDLNDVVNRLGLDPTTRQAVLPVYFPEDTLNNSVRKPCSLFYHFLPYEDQLELYYAIRSCDLYRHFINDLYLAIRLQQWVIDRIYKTQNVIFYPGKLHMAIGSLHLFRADKHHIPELHSRLD
jgi:thymidylate synthase